MTVVLVSMALLFRVVVGGGVQPESIPETTTGLPPTRMWTAGGVLLSANQNRHRHLSQRATPPERPSSAAPLPRVRSDHYCPPSPYRFQRCRASLCYLTERRPPRAPLLPIIIIIINAGVLYTHTLCVCTWPAILVTVSFFPFHRRVLCRTTWFPRDFVGINCFAAN